jgi:hypothetical protein
MWFEQTKPCVWMILQKKLLGYYFNGAKCFYLEEKKEFKMLFMNFNVILKTCCSWQLFIWRNQKNYNDGFFLGSNSFQFL